MLESRHTNLVLSRTPNRTKKKDRRTGISQSTKLNPIIISTFFKFRSLTQIFNATTTIHLEYFPQRFLRGILGPSRIYINDSVPASIHSLLFFARNLSLIRKKRGKIMDWGWHTWSTRDSKVRPWSTHQLWSLFVFRIWCPSFLEVKDERNVYRMTVCKSFEVYRP